MHWFLEFDLNENPLVKLNGIPFNWVKRPYFLIVSSESKNDFVKCYYTAAVPAYLHWRHLSPYILSNRVAFTSIKIKFTIMASKSINTRIWEAEYRWEEGSFVNHWRFFHEFLIPTEKYVSLWKVITLVTASQDKHAQLLGQMSYWRKEEKLGLRTSILNHSPLGIKEVKFEDFVWVPLRPEHIFSRGHWLVDSLELLRSRQLLVWWGLLVLQREKLWGFSKGTSLLHTVHVSAFLFTFSMS